MATAGGMPPRPPAVVYMMPIAVFAIVLVAVFRPRAPLDVELTGRALVVRGIFGATVPWESISSVTLESRLPPLRKRFGTNSATTFAGDFSSDELGRGRVYVRRAAPPYIVARTTDGFLIVNHNAAADTRALYEAMKQRIAPSPPP